MPLNFGPNWTKFDMSRTLKLLCCRLANEYEKALHGLQGGEACCAWNSVTASWWEMHRVAGV